MPTTTLAEVTKTNAPAVLIETAYHDNPQDAEWIRTHIQEMAANLVKSLTDIFEYRLFPLLFRNVRVL